MFSLDQFSGTFPMNIGVSGFAAIAYIGVFITVILHIAFAVGGYIDARYMLARKKGPFLVAPFFWALAILVGGLPIVAVYWAIHHSTLRHRSTANSASAN